MNHETMEILFVIGAVETIIILAALSLVLLLRIRKAKKTDQQAVDNLAINVKDNIPERRETLLKVFLEYSDMDQEQSNTAVDSFIKREQAFYKTLMSIYVNRDAKEFIKLSSGLEEMITPYAEIARSTSTIVSAGEETVEALQKENEELGKELDDSKEIMDELLTEFSASFDKNGEGILPEAIKVKQEENVQSDSAGQDTEEPEQTEAGEVNEKANSQESSTEEETEGVEFDLDFSTEEVLEKEAVSEQASAEKIETNEEVETLATTDEEVSTESSEETPVVDDVISPATDEGKNAKQPQAEEAIDLDPAVVELEVDEEIKNEILEEIDNNNDVAKEEIAAELIVEDNAEELIDSDNVESTENVSEAVVTEEVSKEAKKEVSKEAKEESVDDILGELDIA